MKPIKLSLQRIKKPFAWVSFVFIAIFLLTACGSSKDRMSADDVREQLKKEKCGECTKS